MLRDNYWLKFWSFVGAYVLGAVLTYGYLYNESYEAHRCAYPSVGPALWAASARLDAMGSSFAWPLTWAGRLSVSYFSQDSKEEVVCR